MSHTVFLSNRLARPLLWLLVSLSPFLGARHRRVQPKRVATPEVRCRYRRSLSGGAWTGVRIDQAASIRSIETRDGDGVEVRYTQPEGNDTTDWSYVVPGSEAAPLIVRDDEGHRRLRLAFRPIGSPSRGPAMIPLEMPWIVVAGRSPRCRPNRRQRTARP